MAANECNFQAELGSSLGSFKVWTVVFVPGSNRSLQRVSLRGYWLLELAIFGGVDAYGSHKILHGRSRPKVGAIDAPV